MVGPYKPPFNARSLEEPIRACVVCGYRPSPYEIAMGAGLNAEGLCCEHASVTEDAPRVETCATCGEPDPRMERVDGGKFACLACCGACHFCEATKRRAIEHYVDPRDCGLGEHSDPILRDGKVGICGHHYASEVFGITTVTVVEDAPQFPDTEIGF